MTVWQSKQHIGSLAKMTVNENDDWSPDKIYQIDKPTHFTDEEKAEIKRIKEPDISIELIKSLGEKNRRKNSAIDTETEKLFKKRFTFESISLKGNSKQMEEQMLEDVCVLPGLAILGQTTVFYGGPNFGKTLIVMSEIIKAINIGNFEPGKDNAALIIAIGQLAGEVSVAKTTQLLQKGLNLTREKVLLTVGMGSEWVRTNLKPECHVKI